MAILSKEEQIDQKALRADYFDDATEVLHLGDAARIMDTYAEQVAIGFAEWVHRIYTPTATNPKRWYKTGEIDKGRYETEQLYSMYLQSLQPTTDGK